MRFFRSRRGKLTAGIVLLAALFVARPGAQRLRTRIVESISLALGRQVDVASVKLRFLPQPGFDLEDLVVHDDPAFSAEPVLRSGEVTAALRVSSLLRGRLEIARLSLAEPSINLVRNAEGRWNLENLLERAARTPVAPTGKSKREARPAFPYIEADRGRINLKFGPEKKPYALTEADFALWQDSENAWSMRLKAQPMRTDFNLTDTGLVSVNGSWQRAASLRETPLQFGMRWDRAQLGQVTKLIYGNDKGWRGAVALSVDLSGTPANLMVQADAAAQDFRRYDIAGGGSLRLAARCNGYYSTVRRTFSNLACRAPVGSGAITLEGSVAGLPVPRTYDLALSARQIPMQSLVSFLHHAKKGIPDDLISTGNLSANIRVRRADETEGAVWEGGGETAEFRLRSRITRTELALDKIPFVIVSAGDRERRSRSAPRTERVSSTSSAEARVVIGPFNLALGKPAPAVVSGRISRSGYDFEVQGDAQLQRLLQVARTVGLAAPQPAADGAVRVDLQIAGAWSGFAAPKAVGQAQLHSVRAAVRGLNAPLEIASATLLIAPEQVTVQKLTASLAGTTLHGSLMLARQCAAADGCPIGFDLHADQLATDELAGLLSPQPGKQPWYRFLSSAPRPGNSYLASLHAVGKLTATRVTIHKLAASRVSTNLELDHGRLRLSDLRGDVIGGKHIGDWTADFTVRPPEYSGSGKLEHVGLGQLAETMRDGWITGTANAKYRATASGMSSAELLSATNATLQLEVRDGWLPHITLADRAGPLRINRLLGRLLFRAGKFELQESKLETVGGVYQVSGTATLARALDLKFVRDSSHGFNITGTLTEPRVVPITIPETRAALKP